MSSESGVENKTKTLTYYYLQYPNAEVVVKKYHKCLLACYVRYRNIVVVLVGRKHTSLTHRSPFDKCTRVRVV